jgi:hypothetical protein
MRSTFMVSVLMSILNYSLSHSATQVKGRRCNIFCVNTLSERIIEAMDTSGVSVRQVATACDMSYQGVRKWRTMETQSLDGKHLIALGRLTGFEPEWLMTGAGPKHRMYAKNECQTLTLKAMQKMPDEEQHKIPAFLDLFTESKKRTSQ